MPLTEKLHGANLLNFCFQASSKTQASMGRNAGPKTTQILQTRQLASKDMSLYALTREPVSHLGPVMHGKQKIGKRRGMNIYVASLDQRR